MLRVSAIALALILAASPASSRPGAAHEAFFAGDYERALLLASKSALADDASAQVLLGMMYRHGKGVRSDPVAAYVWFSLAIANGDQFARLLRRELSDEMSADEIALARQMLVARTTEKDN